MSKVIKLDPKHFDPDDLNEAARGIREGKSVIFPTSGLYGLGVDAANKKAVERIFQIKKRASEKPILLLISSSEELAQIVAAIPATAQNLMGRFWPGNLTVIFPARKSVLKQLTAGTGKIGVRQAAHPIARAMIKKVGRPITGTSANFSGSPGYGSVDAMPLEFAAAVDWVIDAGPLTGGMESTVVDVTVNPPNVLREGRISTTILQATLTA